MVPTIRLFHLNDFALVLFRNEVSISLLQNKSKQSQHLFGGFDLPSSRPATVAILLIAQVYNEESLGILAFVYAFVQCVKAVVLGTATLKNMLPSLSFVLATCSDNLDPMGRASERSVKASQIPSSCNETYAPVQLRVSFN
jgi:hypothetical protein